MSTIHISGSIPAPFQSLSSLNSLTGGSMRVQVFFLNTKISKLSLTIPSNSTLETKTIRMGGGPRTYPGGVSKWQWKRMQAKKANQLLKARLARERQIYEMRKRAELKAAVSELERPWETIDKAPTLFSTSADEQLKVLADRFQRPGGFDLWSERDGPELFRPDNGLPSTRFFPKGVVHSVKPYGRVEKKSDEIETVSSLKVSGTHETDGNINVQRKGHYDNSTTRRLRSGYDKGRDANDFRSRNLDDVAQAGRRGKVSKERFADKGFRRKSFSDSEVGVDPEINRNNHRRSWSLDDAAQEGHSRKVPKGRFAKKGIRRTSLSDSEVGVDPEINRNNHRLGDIIGDFGRSSDYAKREDSCSGVYDMTMQNDESYGFELNN